MAIVRKDKLLAGYNGNLESVKVHNNAGSATAQTTNGVFVVVEGLMAGEREVKKARLGALADKALDLCLIHNAEVMYDERLYKLADYKIDAGKVARAYRLHDGDVITLTTDLFSGTLPVVGDKCVIQANGLIGKAAIQADIDASKFVFVVIEDAGFDLHPTMGALAVQVLRNK